MPAGAQALIHGLSREGIEVIDRGEPLPHFDVHCPLLSLPLAFDTTLSSIPDDVPYLRPDPAEAEKWGLRLRGLGKGVQGGLGLVGAKCEG